jgi:hypothetical protein
MRQMPMSQELYLVLEITKSKTPLEAHDFSLVEDAISFALI